MPVHVHDVHVCNYNLTTSNAYSSVNSQPIWIKFWILHFMTNPNCKSCKSTPVYLTHNRVHNLFTSTCIHYITNNHYHEKFSQSCKNISNTIIPVNLGQSNLLPGRNFVVFILANIPGQPVLHTKLSQYSFSHLSFLFTLLSCLLTHTLCMKFL